MFYRKDGDHFIYIYGIYPFFFSIYIYVEKEVISPVTRTFYFQSCL